MHDRKNANECNWYRIHHPDHSTTAGVLCSCCMSASSCQLLCVNTHPKILNKVISNNSLNIGSFPQSGVLVRNV